MQDSMPGLLTDTSSDDLLNQESNGTDSGNSEVQWGGPHIIWQPEFSGEVSVALTDSDDDGQVLWGLVSTSSNETQHDSDDGVVLGVSRGVSESATSGTESVEMVLDEFLEVAMYRDDVVQLSGGTQRGDRNELDDDLSNNDIGFGSVSYGSDGDGGAQLLSDLQHTVSDEDTTDVCCEDLNEASVDLIGDARDDGDRIQVEEDDCLLENHVVPDQF